MSMGTGRQNLSRMLLWNRWKRPPVDASTTTRISLCVGTICSVRCCPALGSRVCRRHTAWLARDPWNRSSRRSPSSTYFAATGLSQSSNCALRWPWAVGGQATHSCRNHGRGLVGMAGDCGLTPRAYQIFVPSNLHCYPGASSSTAVAAYTAVARHHRRIRRFSKMCCNSCSHQRSTPRILAVRTLYSHQPPGSPCSLRHQSVFSSISVWNSNVKQHRRCCCCTCYYFDLDVLRRWPHSYPSHRIRARDAHWHSEWDWRHSAHWFGWFADSNQCFSHRHPHVS